MFFVVILNRSSTFRNYRRDNNNLDGERLYLFETFSPTFSVVSRRVSARLLGWTTGVQSITGGPSTNRCR